MLYCHKKYEETQILNKEFRHCSMRLTVQYQPSIGIKTHCKKLLEKHFSFLCPGKALKHFGGGANEVTRKMHNHATRVDLVSNDLDDMIANLVAIHFAALPLHRNVVLYFAPLCRRQ